MMNVGGEAAGRAEWRGKRSVGDTGRVLRDGIKEINQR
jgi:hypothetical protein